MGKEWLIFVLGTNNWQGVGQFAPGSGILHQGQHIALNALDAAHCYSIWPSDIQKTPVDADDYRVYEIPHPIPICESVGPQSSKRWHSMSEAESKTYCDKLYAAVWDYITYIEDKHKRPINLFFAHHCFMNPVVLSDINTAREKAGKPRVPLVVFAHGTALKMYENELSKLDEFPMRYYTWMREETRVFEASSKKVDGVFAISSAQKQTFEALFPTFPSDRVVVTPNGYNQLIFHRMPGLTRSAAVGSLPQVLYEGYQDDESERGGGIGHKKLVPGVDAYDKVVVFCGRFADWKRLDTLLSAASRWEREGLRYLTLIVGGGSHKACKEYVDLAYKELQLKHTFFLGPQGQPEIAKLFNIADVGVFPSKDEPFGLVFVECMGCGTPVIGARSGGPVDFVTDEAGVLVKEGTSEEVSAGVYAAVTTALRDCWKQSKGPRCEQYALERFSLVRQATDMLQSVETVFLKTA